MDLVIAGLHGVVLATLSWCTYRMIALTCRRQKEVLQERTEDTTEYTSEKSITNEEVVEAFIQEHPTLAAIVDRSVLMNFCKIITSSDSSDPSEVFEKFMNQSTS